MTRLDAVVPPKVFLLPILTRGAFIWLAARITVGAFIAMLYEGSVIRIAIVGSVWLAGIAGFLNWLDVRRRQEYLLLGNLGVSAIATFVWSALPAVLLECSAALAAHVSA